MQARQQVNLLPSSNIKVSDDLLGCVVLASSGVAFLQIFSWIADSYDKTGTYRPPCGRWLIF